MLALIIGLSLALAVGAFTDYGPPSQPTSKIVWQTLIGAVILGGSAAALSYAVRDLRGADVVYASLLWGGFLPVLLAGRFIRQRWFSRPGGRSRLGA